jgi:hypothetical protein
MEGAEVNMRRQKSLAFSRNSPPFMGREGPQQPAKGHCPEPDDSNPHPPA